MANPLRSLLGAASGLAHSRLALIGTELREEQGRFARLLLGGCAALVLGGLGLGAASVALLLALSEAHRVVAALALALVFLAACAYALLGLRRLLQDRTAPFAASLAELERDRAALVDASRESRATFAESGAELLRLASIGIAAYSIGKRLRRAT